MVHLVDFLELEACVFGEFAVADEHGEEAGHDAVGLCHFIAGGDNHEDVAEFLFGSELIAALFVGLGEFVAVADEDVGHAQPLHLTTP